MQRLTCIYAIHQTHEFSGCAQLDMSLWFPFVTWMFLLIVSAGFCSQDDNRKNGVLCFHALLSQWKLVKMWQSTQGESVILK